MRDMLLHVRDVLIWGSKRDPERLINCISCDRRDERNIIRVISACLK